MSQATLSELAARKCAACQGETPALQGAALNSLLDELGHDWRIIQERQLEKEFRFANFREALDFTNRVGELAEQQNHHPDIGLSWGKAKVTIWTHKVNGLTESDFVLAAQIEALAEKQAP
jgi:4a-hydroxytetrahydrobiopterin dehydratase